MLTLTPALRVFVALQPVDLRKSFNGLSGFVQEVLQHNPLSGCLFVFTNRHRTRIKTLFWDGSGLWVCAKRLERGRFGWPAGEGAQVQLRGDQWHALVNGLEVQERAGWYRK
jgi:transposase